MYEQLIIIVQIIIADIILSGDNALIIGMAAAGVPQKYRKWAIFIGLALAAILRIIFAVIASFLLKIPGILLIGGLLLAWVCWRFYKDLRENLGTKKHEDLTNTQSNYEQDESALKSLRKALITIAIADVSMSIDNVIAIAAIAREDTTMMIFGISLAILLMAVGATLIMKILTRFPILGYAGLLFLVYLTGKILYDGVIDLHTLF